MTEGIFFWICAIAAVGCALAVVFPPLPRARAPIHSAIALVACFFFLAGTYALLQAHLLAVLQIMVYAGAIMVLFVFVIMLLNLAPERQEKLPIGPMKVFAAALVVSTGFVLVTAFAADDFIAPISTQLVATLSEPATFGSLESIGRLLFNRYLLPFELTSILLLVAIVGAVIIAKRDPRTTYMPEEQRARLARQRHGKTPEGNPQ